MLDILATKDAQELRDLWQTRALVHTRKMPLGAVMLSVIAHSWPDAMEVLLRVAFPGFQSITAPFLCSAGRIAKDGSIVADLIERGGNKRKDARIFKDDIQLRDYCRKLSDDLKLDDYDRIDMFNAVRRWVVADRRLNPRMDPRDPDAKNPRHALH